MSGSIRSYLCKNMYTDAWEYEVVYIPFANHKIIFRGDVVSRAEGRAVIKACKDACRQLKESQCTQQSR